jgi:PAS domain S-box-containing protein
MLDLARLACGGGSGVVRLIDHEPIAIDPAVPLAIEQTLAVRAAALEAPLAIFHDPALPYIRFYASAWLVDSSGRFRGTFALLDDRQRLLSAGQQHLFLTIASQLMREIESIETIGALNGEIARLRPMLDAMPVALFGYGIEHGRLSYVNPKFAATLGYEVEEVLALPSVLDIIAEDQRHVVAEMIRNRESGDERPSRFVVGVRRKDGTILQAEVHGSVTDHAGGRIIIGAAVDVTSHMADHRQLRDREEYFRALTDHLSDVIAIIDGDHVVTYLNSCIERILGHTREELIGRVFPDAFPLHPDDRERLMNALQELARNGRVQADEYRFQHENGRWLTLEVAGTNLLDDGPIRGLLIHLHDITDRKRMEQELTQLQRLTSLGRLSAQVAHEFNNVLMGIQPVVDLMRRQPGTDPSLFRFTDAISASIARGKRITSDILRFGRPAQPALHSVPVRTLVHQASGEIGPWLPDDVLLDVTIEREPMFVRADAAQLLQVLINLALNAKDAMQNGGILTISARPAEEGEIADAQTFIHLTVRDTGSGIAPRDLPYIFEPLFSTKNSGTGLGLSVVLQIVAAHGGHITVDSERGRGTAFHLFVPAAEPAPAIAEPAPVSDRGVSPSLPLRVLVVDDEETVSQGLRWALEAEGMTVHVAARGADVLPAIAEFAPDIVVLDLSLPDESGRSVYERIAATASLPVIFSTGNESEIDVEALTDGSRTAFLLKPYAVEELLATIKRLIDRFV